MQRKSSPSQAKVSSDKTPRIIFFGTPDLAVSSLRALLESGMPPLAVVTQPPEPVGRKAKPTPSAVESFARNNGLEVITPKSLRRPDFVKWFTEHKPDIAVLVAYGKIIPEYVLNTPAHGFINVHPSLLPKHRGATPITGTILSGDTQTGVTLIKLDHELDHGPIIAQRAIAMPARATTQSLTPLLADLGAKLLVDTLPAYLSGKIVPQEQDHSKATYIKMLKKEDGHIDWEQNSVKLERTIRAYKPWPGTFTKWQDKRLIIHEARVVLNKPVLTLEPGLVSVQDKKIYIGTGEGLLELTRLQISGKKAQTAYDFLNGHSSIDSAQLT